ncbi:TPA: TrmB family transcriptional regulator [Escherichia coli]
MIHLVNKLINFGFTRTDAQVYISLLKNGRSSGYKIAKEISLSRSSVYSSIDNLYKNGYIFLVDGETKEYEAKSPELILSQIEKSTIDNIKILKKELSQMMFQNEREFIYNVSGFDNLHQKAKEMLSSAECEIYLNTDFDLHFLKNEICEALNRHVRVIVFSFNKLITPDLRVELYYRFNHEEEYYPSHRFMLVVDMKTVMVFSQRAESLGLYSNNRLLINIIAEHIHSDIYLTKYQQQYPDANALINTLHESGNDMVQDEKHLSDSKNR